MDILIKAVKHPNNAYYKKMQAIYNSCKEAGLLHQLPNDVKEYFDNKSPFIEETELIIYDGTNSNMVTVDDYVHEGTLITINLNHLPKGASKIIIGL